MEIEEEYDILNHNGELPPHNIMHLEIEQQKMQEENGNHKYQSGVRGDIQQNEISTQVCSNSNGLSTLSTAEFNASNKLREKNKDTFSVYSLHSQLSSSSSSSSSVKRHKASNSFDIESVHSQSSSGDYSRQVEFRVQPIYKQLFPNSYVHIFGDMIIHTDVNNLEDYIGINSPFNQIKKIQQIVYKKINKTLELSLDNTNTTFIGFDNLIQLFSNYPEKTIHELGKNLEKYKNYSIKQQKLVKMCSEQEGYSEFTRLKQVKFERFKKVAMEMVDQHKDEYLCYILFQRNYQTGGLEMKVVGMNEKLISLLGSNVSDYEELVRRVGMYCFQNKYIYNYILSKYIEQMGQCMKKSGLEKPSLSNNGVVKAFSLEYQTSMLTLDDFVVETNNTLETYVDCTDEDSDISNDLLKFRDMFHMFKLNISDETIQTLKYQRSNTTSSHMDIVQKESLYYELEASVFLEKFYGPKRESQEDIKKKQQQDEIEKQKMCGFRVIS